MTIASVKNCTRMSPRLAPTALRRPTSRVRSVTLTSMMFMMPMPPTSSEMAAMLPSKVVKVLEVEVTLLRMSAWLRTRKSLSAPAASLCRDRMIAVTCACARSISSAERTWRLMVLTVVVPAPPSFSCAVCSGTMITSSWFWGPFVPLDSSTPITS